MQIKTKFGPIGAKHFSKPKANLSAYEAKQLKDLANKNIYQFLHCQNALEINDSLFISGLFDKIYINKFSHFGQNGILGVTMIH